MMSCLRHTALAALAALTAAATPAGCSSPSSPARTPRAAARATSGCVESAALSCAEQHALVAIGRAAEASRHVWAGRFRLAALPMLLVSTANAAEEVRGVLINAGAALRGAKRVSRAAARGLDVYRLDRAAPVARRAIDRANGRFDNFFSFEGVALVAIRYTPRDARSVTSARSRWLDLLVHESFHVYQQRWRKPPHGTQDESRYPKNRAVLALGLLEASIAVDALRARERRSCRRYLEQLVSARTAKIDAEPGSARMVFRMDGLQEAIEGSAEHVERRVRERLAPRRVADCVAERADVVDAIIAGDIEGKRARSFFSWELFYLTGAAWLSLLECTNTPYRRALESGASPFEVARRHVQASPDALASAKREQKFAKLRVVTERFALGRSSRASSGR